MSYKIRGAVALTGGAAGAVDAVDGAVLADMDIMIVVVPGAGLYVYVLDADSGLTESSPNRIVPDTNPGTKVWLLQAMVATGFSEV